MKLSRKDWNNYVTRLSAINKTAGKKMGAYIANHGTDDVEALVEYAFALTTRYGEAASAVACEMYDEVAAIQKANVPPAVPKPTQSIKYVDAAVRGALGRAPTTVPNTISEMVKRTGAETTLKNALRDGAYFAWVPNGDTCAFCITLASNGWRRASKKTINGDHAEHIHKNCDCEFAISFNGPGEIEGYDPDKYLAMYENAEGTKWQDKVNSMRRAHYAANKDAINAQKRVIYNRKKAVDVYGGSKYNIPPVDDDALKRRYERDVKDGWISPNCGLDNYKSLYYKIDHKVIGLETPNGITITGQSEHFLTRVIGTSLNPSNVVSGVYQITTKGALDDGRFKSNARSGVRIADVIDTIKNGHVEEVKYSVDGKPSQKIEGLRCDISFNPETGQLIQCNP